MADKFTHLRYLKREAKHGSHREAFVVSFLVIRTRLLARGMIKNRDRIEKTSPSL